MNNLRDCRAQEAQCRKRALTDQEHGDLWLSMAERWSYLANKEATFHVGKGIFLRRDDDFHDDDSSVKADA